MTPTVPIVLNGLARTMLMDLAPQVTAAYAGQTLQLAGMLSMMIAQEFERAAARLVEENGAVEALLADAADVIGDRELARLAAVREPSLLISALQARNSDLRGALTRLHAQVEALDTPAARDLEARIWAELVQSTRRRLLDMAMPS
ncbi:MAG TPA: hypothetical protein VL049_29205 [Candidatus Dormibacteraeota bacterium]|nr:hypothetical protein [Candidatus Dormibacteraeota bacterium]